MTEAVGTAAPNAPLVTAKRVRHAGAETAKSNSKTSHEIKSKASLSKEALQASDDPQSQASVQGTKSTQSAWQRTQNDENDALSFEQTIDGLDKKKPTSAPADANVPAQVSTFAAQLTLGQMALHRTVFSTAVTSNTEESSDNRILGQGRTKALSSLLSTKEPSLPKLEKQAQTTPLTGDADPSNEKPIMGTMSVLSSETHWNFGAQETRNASLANLAIKSGIAGSNPMTATPASSNSNTREDISSSAPQSTGIPSVAANVSSSKTFNATFGGNGNDGTGDRETSPKNAEPAGLSKSAKEALDADVVDHDVAANAGAPAPISNVGSQVQKGVVSALSSVAADPQNQSAAYASVAKPAVPSPVLRSIEISLSPADLGSVRLRLSLKSNTLAIEAETSKSTAAKILNDDRGALEQNLRDAGYDVSSLKITDASASNSAGLNTSSGGNASFQDNGQTRTAFADRRDGSWQERNRGGADQGQSRSQGDQPQAQPTPDRSRSRRTDEVYI